MSAIQVTRSEDLDNFLNRVQKEREREALLVAWHIKVHEATGIELPWTPDETYITANQYKEGKRWDEDGLDIEATLDMLSAIAKYAVSMGCKVDKEYDYSFTLKVTVSESPLIKVRYVAERESVCTKKVVGTTVTPAKVIPEKIEEVIEWECEKVSLLGR